MGRRRRRPGHTLYSVDLAAKAEKVPLPRTCPSLSWRRPKSPPGSGRPPPPVTGKTPLELGHKTLVLFMFTFCVWSDSGFSSSLPGAREEPYPCLLTFSLGKPVRLEAGECPPAV